MATVVSSGSSDFSYLTEASVVSPIFLTAFLIATALNVALSKSNEFVWSVMPDFSPPLIPAMATGTRFSSQITTLCGATLCTPPSKVNMSISFSGSVTTMPPTMLWSNACIGWPSSSIK